MPAFDELQLRRRLRKNMSCIQLSAGLLGRPRQSRPHADRGAPVGSSRPCGSCRRRSGRARGGGGCGVCVRSMAARAQLFRLGRRGRSSQPIERVGPTRPLRSCPVWSRGRLCCRHARGVREGADGRPARPRSAAWVRARCGGCRNPLRHAFASHQRAAPARGATGRQRFAATAHTRRVCRGRGCDQPLGEFHE